MYIYIYTHIWMHGYIYMYMNIYVYTYLHVYRFIHTYTYILTYSYIMHLYVHVFIFNLFFDGCFKRHRWMCNKTHKYAKI